MKYFSMFSGIGGFELGIQRAFDTRQEADNQRGNTKSLPKRMSNSKRKYVERPLSCVGYSEIDKYAIQTYERNFNESCNEHAHISKESQQEKRSQRGKRSLNKQELLIHNRNRSTALCDRCRKGHTNYGNATTINASELPDFDLLVGGFPCQAFSIAGKRAGFNDTRGTLFFDIARILAEKRPRHLVLENVKGLLSHEQGKTFQTILGVLADLGYRVEWQVLNSKDFGVPQNRERVFIVGHFGGECTRQIFPLLRKNPIACKEIGTITAIKGAEHSRRCYSLDGISPTVSTMMGGNTEKKFQDGLRIRRLTPTECERLQGFPDGWTIGSDTQRYKQCGNAVTVNVVQAVIESLYNHAKI